MDKNSSGNETVRRATAGDTDTGNRLDRFLAGALSDLSRSRLSQLIAAGAVTCAGVTIKDANHRVKCDECYLITLPPVVSAEPVGQDIPLDIIFEDEDLIVVNKPAGMVVHPAAGNPDGTLVNALIGHCGDSLKGIGGEMRPGIVHRIDKETSGLLVSAKNERAMTSLAKQFAHHTIERVYTAVVWGLPRPEKGTVETELDRSPFDRKRMAVVRSGGKHAITHYAVQEIFGGRLRPFASLIECRLETGRTHQIRVHMTHSGHPLIGDPVYGRSRKAPKAKTPEEEAAYAATAGFSRQALHAGVLGFWHPTTQKKMHFEAPLPQDLADLIAALRGLNAS